MAFFVNRYHSSGTSGFLREIIKVSSGFFLIGGAGNKGFITKIDTQGNIQWSKRYSFSIAGIPRGFSRAIDTGQNLVLVYTSSFAYGENVAGVCAVDYNGELLWNKQIYSSLNHPFGGTGTVGSRSILAQTLNLVGGFLYITFVDIIEVFNYQHYSIIGYKLTTSGSPIDSKESDLSGEARQLFIYFVGNSFMITGETNPGGVGFLGKLDLNFNLISKNKITGGDPNFYLTVRGATNVIGNKFFIAGTRTDTVDYSTFIARVNYTTLQIEKFKYFGDVPLLNLNGLQFFDNNVYMSTFSSGVFKFDDEINFSWSKTIESTNAGFGEISTNNITLGLGSQGMASTNLELDSCITENLLPSLNIITDNNYSIVSDGSFSMNSFSEPVSSPTITISTIETTQEDLCPSAPVIDVHQSTIIAQPDEIPADGGTSFANVTVQLIDTNGLPITTGGNIVEIFKTAGTLNPVIPIDEGDGTYTTKLYSSNIVESSLLTFKVDGSDISNNNEVVNFIEVGVTINIVGASIQSPSLYLQAAGSDGAESTKGRHLRWSFRGELGELHLPKGNLATSSANYNKPKDFVNIYRAAYRKVKVSLNFFQDSPQVVDNSNYLWIYRIGLDQREFYVRFGNTTKYNLVLSTINPLSNPTQFLGAYGSELIEIENIKDLFFAVTCNFSQSLTGGIGTPLPAGTFNVETLSVEANTITSSKIVSNRKSLSGGQLDKPLRLVCENGRSIRGRIFNINISSLDFEFYDTFINDVNNTTGWKELGPYALSLNNTDVLTQLEPSPGDVHGKWQRFNDNAFVNIDNYEDKWDGTPETGDRTIKQIVDRYIDLSNNAANPTATEDIPLGNDPGDPNDIVTISNLDILNLAAGDYHIARMLGLGILDIDEPVSFTIKGGKGELDKIILTDQKPNYVYIAEYFTAGEPNPLAEEQIHHLYMSLPTSNNDDRLPIPVDLDRIDPGLFIGGSTGEGSPLTDDDGYTYDGLSRYVSLYSKELLENDINAPFFVSTDEVNLEKITTSIFGGLEHRIGLSPWDKPELSNDPEYYNAGLFGEPLHFETRFILIPEPEHAYHIHRQTIEGWHTYEAYGINWFSRSKRGDTQLVIHTELNERNPLKAPSNTNALLIRPEGPLLLTSPEEQARLAAISGDKTLIRLSFNYHSTQELKDYRIPVDSTVTNAEILHPDNADDPTILYPDIKEIYADQIDIFFRNEIPNNVTGKALNVTDHDSDETLSIITTGTYLIASNGQNLIPFVAPGTEDNFVGGVFVSGENKYVIYEVIQGTEGPIFTVYKKEISESILAGGLPSNNTNGELEAPVLTSDGLFMAIENMQNAESWGTPNPLGFKVDVGDNWNIHREIIELVNDDGEVERHVEKSRGIWDDATVSKVLEADGSFIGMYKIAFSNVILPQNSQHAPNGVSSEWYRGSIRLFTVDTAPTGFSGIASDTRKVLPVLKIENIDTLNKLVVYAQDPSYSDNSEYDPVKIGSIEVNFYPGYKVYLYEDTPFGLNEENILPEEGEDMRYSIFGFRSHDPNGGCDGGTGSCYSRISAPSIMYAQELIEAKQPELPEGPLYATRPDFFGRSTYTITTKYGHKPHGILVYRSNDEALLNALYEKSTILQIRESLKTLGGNNEEYLTNRWQNFLNFEELALDGDFKLYPPADVSSEGYKFPNPDKQAFFDWANTILTDLGSPIIPNLPGSLAVGDPIIIGFVEGIIYNAFVPLTEMPILYKYLNDADYQVIDSPQVIRDRAGGIVAPFDPKTFMDGDEDTGFRMAPMAKIIGPIDTQPKDETLFTDFKLDGTSNNLYFYGVKELSTQLKMSEFSPFLGPIKMVNTNAAETPEVKRIVPILGNSTLDITPKILLEVNAFPEVQNVKKLRVYRSDNMINAQSVQSMQLAKEIDLEQENLLGEAIWSVTDDFINLAEVPFGDSLFYRVTVLREVEYADKDGNILTEYAPSQASKIVASAILENRGPSSPVLRFLSTQPNINNEIDGVILAWNKTAYNARYHIYKMNNEGNWQKIHELVSNEEDVQVNLFNTDLGSDTLNLLDVNGNVLYHHFKVIAENTSGLLSKEENTLTIFNEDDWTEV